MDTARSGRGLYICLQTTLAHAIYPRMPDTCGLFFLAGARQVRVDRRRYGGGPLATASVWRRAASRVPCDDGKAVAS